VVAEPSEGHEVSGLGGHRASVIVGRIRDRDKAGDEAIVELIAHAWIGVVIQRTLRCKPRSSASRALGMQ